MKKRVVTAILSVILLVLSVIANLLCTLVYNFFRQIGYEEDPRYNPGFDLYEPEAVHEDVENFPEEAPAPTVAIPESEEAPSTDNSASWLTVHYIDVGQADCALLECGDEYLLIDGGNREDSQLVVAYLEQQGIAALDYVISTHAHEDHIGGLPAVLKKYPVEVLYSPVTVYSSQLFSKFTLYAHEQELLLTVPAPGDSFSLGDARVTILGPTRSYTDPNNTSIVCRVVFGDTSFLFTGDMEKAAESDLLDAGAYVKSDVLKVGHHGSDTSTGYRFLREVDPEYAVISVGQGNDYGHPHEATVSRLCHCGMTIFRTDTLGTVVARSDGEEIVFFWENQNALPELAEYAGIYIGNSKSLRLHTQDCANLPKAHNQVIFDSLQQALEEGYTPCASCMG